MSEGARSGGRTLAKEFAVLVAGQAAAALGSLVGVAVLTSLLEPAVYGEVALAATIATLAQQVTLLPLGGAALRFFPAATEAGERREFLRAVRHLGQQASLLVVAAAGLAAALLALVGSRWPQLALPATLLAVTSGGCALLDNLQTAARQRSVVAWHQAAGQWLRFCVPALLLSRFPGDSLPVLWGFALAALVVFGSQLLFLSRLGAGIPGVDARSGHLAWASKLRSYAWPFALWGLPTWAQGASDRWALQVFGDASGVGLYVALYQVGYYPLVIVSSLVMQLLAPPIFALAGAASDEARIARARVEADRLASIATLVAIAAAVVAHLIHAPLFSVLVAPRYRLVSPLLPLMVFAGGLFGAGQVATLAALSGSDTRGLIAPKIGSALIGIALNVVAAYRFGVEGVVLATAVSTLVYWSWVRWAAASRGAAQR